MRMSVDSWLGLLRATLEISSGTVDFPCDIEAMRPLTEWMKKRGISQDRVRLIDIEDNVNAA